jgi:hypothetical protein
MPFKRTEQTTHGLNHEKENEDYYYHFKGLLRCDVGT